MATKKTTEEVIEIRPIRMERVKLRIVGDTPLIVHKWSEKAKREMLEAQSGKKTAKKKEAKDPVADFISSLYWLTPEPKDKTEKGFAKAVREGARFGFPVTAIKKAGLSAAYRKGWIKNRLVMAGDFFIQSDDDGLIEIHSSEPPEIREDMVKVGMGTADIRYRAMFRDWWADLDITYDADGAFGLDSIVNTLSAGGTICGIGEWRVEKSGQNGMFHIESMES